MPRRRTESSPPQPIDEIAAHVGPEGPVTAAHQFLRIVLLHRDFRSAWRRMDATLRLCIAQAWLWANRKSIDPVLQDAAHDLDGSAAALASEEPAETALWEAFATTQQRNLVETLMTSTRDPSRLAAASRPRPVADDLELVLFVDSQHGDHMIYRPDATRILYRMLMRRTDRGWLVAGLMSDKPPLPGWPPQFPRAESLPPRPVQR